jgi:nucleotide-binding universal stress UspA family protein
VTVMTNARSTGSSRRSVIVAYADDGAGDAALRVAAREARLRGTSLTIMHKLVGQEAPEVYGGSDLSGAQRRAALHRLVRVAHEVAPGIDDIDVRTVPGPLDTALVVASRSAELLVLGTTTGHATAAALLDTVPRHLSRHAHCPVMITPAGSEDVSQVMCGTDRSANSTHAAAWAAAEAARRGVTLLVVELLPASNHQAIVLDDETLTGWVRDHLPPAATTALCSTEVAFGSTAHRLLDIAVEQNALLVIGSHDRDRHRWTRSVARVATAQSRQPVVVVPPDWAPRPEPARAGPGLHLAKAPAGHS